MLFYYKMCKHRGNIYILVIYCTVNIGLSFLKSLHAGHLVSYFAAGAGKPLCAGLFLGRTLYILQNCSLRVMFMHLTDGR